MPKISKHKQAKRKARQRNVKAAKQRSRLKESQQLVDEHAMSDEMKAQAKEKFWKVFSKLPTQLQKEAIKDFETNGGHATPMDIDGMTELLCEGMNYYIRPHAMVDTLHSLVQQEKVTLEPKLLELMDQMDEATLKYISGATKVLGCFQKIQELPEAERQQAILDDDVLGDDLIPTLLAYQEDYDTIIAPLIELAEVHSDLIDEDIEFHSDIRGEKNLYNVARAIHLERVEQLIKQKANKDV
ncbi:hypothetical protein HWC35_gp102 [Vibrio phage USC-1]|uniref:Uncharacterized protein n=2 Tax=Aphroditevirus USC1 TaxID=2846605 RepID=A0A514A2P5_9CAUD|nr:hypothetical protein HWC35_gp102 [Vibrio phage USC-1]QCW23232.1 hypothetical protein [Vibrio phage 5 TSL-2019]QDH47496.1 hypothetical protein [Vibrio phage USC-1]